MVLCELKAPSFFGLLVPFRPPAFCCCLSAHASAPVLCLHQTGPGLFAQQPCQRLVCMSAHCKTMQQYLCSCTRSSFFSANVSNKNIDYIVFTYCWNHRVCTVWDTLQELCLGSSVSEVSHGTLAKQHSFLFTVSKSRAQ